MTKQILEAGRAYIEARIDFEQPNPDERLYTELGRVCYELANMKEE